MLELLHHALQGELRAHVLGIFEGDDVSATGGRQEDPSSPRHMLRDSKALALELHFSRSPGGRISQDTVALHHLASDSQPTDLLEAPTLLLERFPYWIILVSHPTLPVPADVEPIENPIKY